MKRRTFFQWLLATPLIAPIAVKAADLHWPKYAYRSASWDSFDYRRMLDNAKLAKGPQFRRWKPSKPTMAAEALPEFEFYGKTANIDLDKVTSDS